MSRTIGATSLIVIRKVRPRSSNILINLEDYHAIAHYEYHR